MGTCFFLFLMPAVPRVLCPPPSGILPSFFTSTCTSSPGWERP